jgi:hypothetical protein
MKIIYIDAPSKDDKVIIAATKNDNYRLNNKR